VCAYRRGGNGEGAWRPAESNILSGQSRILSSSTLVSEEWLLCRDDASLSRESTDDDVEVELFLRCLDVCGGGLTVFVLIERELSGETIESRMMKCVVHDGGDISEKSTISAEADLMWKLAGWPDVATVARESSVARLGMTTCIWGLEPLPARRPYLEDERLLWRHCRRPFLYVPMASRSEDMLETDLRVKSGLDEDIGVVQPPTASCSEMEPRDGLLDADLRAWVALR
jgi:hypothetical protein